MNRRIFSAAAMVTLCTVLVKVVATGKEVVVARAFGRSDAMDAFLVAQLVPTFFISILAISMNQALVPTLVSVRRREGQEEAQKLFSSAMLWSAALLTLGMMLLAVAAPLVVHLTASNFGSEKARLTLKLFYLLLPIILLSGIGSNCAAVLNTSGKFALPALIPVLSPLFICGAAAWFARGYGTWSISVASVAGALAEALVLIWLLPRSGYRFDMRWFGLTQATKTVAHQYGFVLLAAILSSSCWLVDQSMAAMLKAGSVSALVYGNRIVGAVGQLLVIALATSLTPHYSEMLAKRDWLQCRHTVRTYARLTFAATLPVTVALVFCSHGLTRILYQRGAFRADDTTVVALVQAMYALSLPFMASGRVYNRLIAAMNRNDIISIGGALNLVLDIVFNLLCMHYFGVAGIALSTSLFYVGSYLFNMVMAKRLLNRVLSQTVTDAVV